MWIMMGGRMPSGVNKKRLKQALLAIEGIYNEKKQIRAQSSNKHLSSNTVIDWDSLEDLVSFNFEFICFNNNRKANYEKKIFDKEYHTFKPSILKCSSRLADNHRKKLMNGNSQLKLRHDTNK
jgi:hypothetical protein